MSMRTLIALLVFAGLLAAAILSLRQKPERNITRISFAAVDKEAIDHLEIAGANPIEASKKDGKWVLGDGRDAEETAIKNALEAIPKVESSDLVTANPDRYAELEVDDAKGTRVKASAGGQVVAEFVVGKPGASGTAVRKGDSVYAVKAVYPYYFSKPSAQWHKLKLFADGPDAVSRLEVSLGGEAPYALVKKDEKWALEDPKVVPDGFRFDEGAARALATSLVTLSAKDVLAKDPGPETTRLDAKADVLAFVAKDGARRELHLGATSPEKTVWAQVAGRADVYTLQEPVAKALRKRATDLRDLTLMTLEKDKVQKLEIVDGAAKLVLEKQGADWKIGTSTVPVPADFVLDPTLVKRRLMALGTVRALAPAAAGAAAALEKPTAKITATLADGTAVLAFGAATKANEQDAVFAKGNADASAYVVAKWTRDQLVGGLGTFQKQPEQAMPAFDPQQLQNLPPEVRQQLMQQMMQQRQGGPPPMKLPPAAK